MDDIIVIDWGVLTLFLLILMRMSGFVMVNPLFGIANIPNQVKAGLILIFGIVTFSLEGGSVPVPQANIQLVLMLLMEFFLGAMLSAIMNFFFSIPAFAGSLIDTQMGLSMGQTYDPTTKTNVTVSALLLNILMTMIFFANNGHHTLFRIFMTSSDLVPYGSYWFGENVLNAAALLFCECILLGVKLVMPILAAELLCQVGMGVLMKAIPQINVFAINIDLKIIIGLGLMALFLESISYYLLEIEVMMLDQLTQWLSLAGENQR